MHFLLYISEPYSIPIGRPLQKEIQSRGYEVKWFCDVAETKKHLAKEEQLLHSIAEVKAYNPDIVLVATNVVPDFFPGLKVQIFHGFSVGKRSASKGHFNIRGFFDLYCTQGPSTTLPFQKLKKRYYHFEVIETGWSKVDPLFPLNHTQNKRPIIMVSSTFTSMLSLAKNPEVLHELERISHLGKWKFIAVLHPKMEKEVVEKLKAMQHAYFTFYDTTDLIPLYKQADVMFSDTTSAITEFVLQHKPVVTFANRQPQPYMINITHPSKIENALEIALDRPVEIMAHLDHFIAKIHPYSDGLSSKRVIDASMQILKEGKRRIKPLNLIRRFKIRKKLGYWGLW